MRLPDPQTSLAILIGASKYRSTELSDLPAVRNNLSALVDIIADPESGGFAADRCIVLPDPHVLRDVYRSLRRVAAAASDTLLFYYAGHGLTSAQNELYLSLADTDPDELVVSALPYALIRDIVGDSPASNRIVILDCCFSGRAIQGMSSPEESFAGQVSIEGTYTLTSTAANAVALAPEGATYTAFTGELLSLLRNGLPSGPEFLTFGTVYRELLRTMISRSLPRPMHRGTGTVDQLALTRNRWITTPAAGEPQLLPTPLQDEADHDRSADRPAHPAAVSKGYLPESADLLALARRQRQREMELLVGTPSDAGEVLDHQHLPDLYVERPAMQQAWTRFLASNTIVFSAVGEAGRGKTSLLCTLATELGMRSPVVFYHGSQLDGRLTDALAQDLGFTAGDGEVMEEAARRVKEQGHTLFIFIDALNERAVGRDELRMELNELTRDIRAHDWPIRFAVSCRSGDWLFWVRNARHMLGHFGRAVYRDELVVNSSMPGTPVAAFQPAEMENAWQTYKRGFALTGRLTHKLRVLCREPIFLRLIAEVYRGSTPALERTFSRGALIDRFFDERFPDGSDSIEIMASLFRMSELMLDRERPSVPVSALPPSDLAMCRRLLVEGVLTEKNGALGFRFEIILEHIVARHLRQQLSDQPDMHEVASLITGLTESRLVNTPGIVENLLLSLRDNPDVMLQSLELLAGLDDRWRAVACSVAAHLELPPHRLLPAVRTLAASDNYLIRTLSADTLVGWIDREADAEVLACTDGGDWESRETVAQALGSARKPSPQSLQLLWSLADDYHWRVRRAGGYSLLRTWNQSGKAAKAHDLSRVGEMSWRCRHAVCVGLLGCDLGIASQESDTIGTMSRDENPQVRWCVANYLSRYRNGAGTDVCLTLAEDPSDWVRARLVTSLIGMAEHNPDPILPLLERLASDASPSVRLKMARELPSLPDLGTRTALLKNLAQDTDDVGFAARYSLGLISDVNITLNRPAERDVVLKIFRERVARRDIDIEHARFSKIQGFISERTDVPLGEDPYMHLVDTMCSLTAAAMTALQKTPSAVGELMTLLEQDADEAIRWALVLFLVRYSSLVSMSSSVRVAGLERLSRDPHWWIRREVANGLAEFHGGPYAEQAVELLTQLHHTEAQRAEPCGDEVSYFIDRSAHILGAPQLADSLLRPLAFEEPGASP